MSKWVRGIYNSAANFVMSGSLRAASGSSMGRNPKQLREESGKCDKPAKSCKSNNECGSDTDCLGCAPFSCARFDPNSNYYIGDVKNGNLHVDGCVCSICRDYNDFVAHTSGIRTEGQGAGARIRVSNEPRNFKQSNPDATNTVEQSTGIPTGVTI